MRYTRTVWLLLIVCCMLAGCRDNTRETGTVTKHIDCWLLRPLVFRGDSLRFFNNGEVLSFGVENNTGNIQFYTERFKEGDCAYYARQLPAEAFALSFYSKDLTGLLATDYPYAAPLVGLIIEDGRIAETCFVDEYTVEITNGGTFGLKFNGLKTSTRNVDLDYSLRETHLEKATYHIHKRSDTGNLLVIDSPRQDGENYLLIEMKILKDMIKLTPKQRNTIRFFYVIDLNII